MHSCFKNRSFHALTDGPDGSINWGHWHWVKLTWNAFGSISGWLRGWQGKYISGQVCMDTGVVDLQALFRISHCSGSLTVQFYPFSWSGPSGRLAICASCHMCSSSCLTSPTCSPYVLRAICAFKLAGRPSLLTVYKTCCCGGRLGLTCPGAAAKVRAVGLTMYASWDKALSQDFVPWTKPGLPTLPVRRYRGSVGTTCRWINLCCRQEGEPLPTTTPHPAPGWAAK